MREGFVCCAVDGCKVTGRPPFGRDLFVCTSHMKAGSERTLNTYSSAAARRKSAEQRETRGGRSAVHARAAENTSFWRLIQEVAAKHPMKTGQELA